MFKAGFPNQHWRWDVVGALETCTVFNWIGFLKKNFLLVLACSLSPNLSPQPGKTQDTACKPEVSSEVGVGGAGLSYQNAGWVSEQTWGIGSMSGSVPSAALPSPVLGLCFSDQGMPSPAYHIICAHLLLSGKFYLGQYLYPASKKPIWWQHRPMTLLSFQSDLWISYNLLCASVRNPTQKCSEIPQKRMQWFQVWLDPAVWTNALLLSLIFLYVSLILRLPHCAVVECELRPVPGV